MPFVAHLFEALTHLRDSPAVSEVHGDAEVSVTGAELRGLASRARGALRQDGIGPGDRVVLLAPNAIRWVAADLALLAEGVVVVPMYARQDPAELVQMMHDADPVAVWVATEALAEGVRAHWPDAPIRLFDDVFAADPVHEPPRARDPDEPCTIIYTSGTSGRAKGVVLAVRGVDFLLPRTARALEDMMALGGPVPSGEHRVFHYLPLCFAGSRIVLWTCLWRANGILLSTDLDDLARELATAAPHYVLNVPMLLERIKSRVERGVRDQAAPVQWLYDAGLAAHHRLQGPGRRRRRDRALLGLARSVVFDRLRARIGRNLRCLICGSAPLAEATQRWFAAIGLPVYQVYGLTETTAIVTMDVPPDVVPGRMGRALAGVETRLGPGDELWVRGPNQFLGYWRDPAATTAAHEDGWFRTGDRAEVDDEGRWRIVGRVKNVLVPTSGHNVAPEPLEQRLVQAIEGVDQAVVVGHGRPWLAAVVCGTAPRAAIDAGLAAVNAELPHYRRIRAVHLAEEPFSIENGLLSANRKLRRGAIEAAHAEAIEALYAQGLTRR